MCLVCRANNPTHDQQIIQLLSVNRALLSVNRALLSVYRALSSVYLYVVRWIVCLSCALFVLGHVSCFVFVMVM